MPNYLCLEAYNGQVLRRCEVNNTDISIDKLADILRVTESKSDYDIVEDLRSLDRLYGMLKAKDYRRKLQALIEKYEQSELTQVRAALLHKCLEGDIQAIRLYANKFRPAVAVADDDGLINVLTQRAGEVFDSDV